MTFHRGGVAGGPRPDHKLGGAFHHQHWDFAVGDPGRRSSLMTGGVAEPMAASLVFTLENLRYE